MTPTHCYEFNCYWGGTETETCACPCGPCMGAKDMEEAAEHERLAVKREAYQKENEHGD